MAILILAAAPAASAQTYDAPDPGGNENANVAIPPPGGKYFGLNDDFIDYAHHQSPESYADYAYSAGANAVKMSLDWWRVERFQADQWVDRRWDVWQDAYNAVRARGLTPVLVLSAAPCWARVVPCAPGDATEPVRFAPKPVHDAQWGEFVAEVARRFPDAIIQAWNEPNLLTWWHDGPNPERYVQILRTAFQAVQAVEDELEAGTPDPDDVVQIPVIGPGVTNTLAGDGGPSDMSMSEFLQRAYAVGLDAYNDATSANVFPYSVPGTNEFGEDTRFAESFEQLRDARLAAGDTDPIYITETAIAARTSGTPSYPYTEAQRAFALLRLYNRVMTMPDVGMVITHRIIEPRSLGVGPLEWGYAWLRYVPAPEDQDPQTQAAGLPEPKYVYCLFSHVAYLSSGADEAGRDASRFYEPCGIVITDSQANGDGTWTFTFGAPNYNLFSSLECKVDAGPYGPCTTASSHTTAPLGVGTHTFSVRAIDTGLNPLPPTVQSFPDNVVPVAQIDSGPAEGFITADSTPTFEFSANEPAVFECKVDGASAVPCTSPWRLKDADAFSDATHTLAVVAIDRAGNRSVPVQRSFRVEAAAPVAQIDSGPSEGARVSDSTPTFAFSASEEATFECRVDAGSPADCSSGSSSGSFTPASPLGQGAHTFFVIATDTAGKESAPVQRSFTVDTVAPTASITSGPAQDSTISDTTPTYKFTASEPGSTFKCWQTGDAVFTPCTSPHDTRAFEDGEEAIIGVQAIDQVGNVGAPTFRSFTVQQPDTKITRAKISAEKRKATFKFVATAGPPPLDLYRFKCKLDDGNFKSCDSPKRYKRLKPGRHVFQVRAIDADGVSDPSSDKDRFKIPRRR